MMYNIGYGDKNEDFYTGLKKIQAVGPVRIKKGETLDQKQTLAIRNMLYAKVASNRSAIVANGFDPNKVSFNDSVLNALGRPDARIVGGFDPDTDSIMISSDSEQLKKSALTLTHESIHRSFEDLFKEKARDPVLGTSASAAVEHVGSRFVAYMEENLDRFNPGLVKQVRDYMTERGWNESATRFVNMLVTGEEDTIKTPDGKFKATLDLKDVEDFKKTPLGMEAMSYIEAIERMAQESIRKKLPGEGSLPLPKI